MTIRHVVTWKLAAADAAQRAEDARRITEELQALRGLIPGMQDLTVGGNVVPIAGNWDVALVADFVDAAALESYQLHPAHQKAGAFIRSVVAERSAVDFEL